MSSDYEDQNDNALKESDAPFRLFVDDSGFAAGFFFHDSIKNSDQRAHLKKNIEHYGGVVLNDFADADTVLVHPTYQKAKTLEIAYNATERVTRKNIHVEKMTYIQNCIKYRLFSHRERTIEGMGGTLGSRTEYTEEDDDHLAYYLATRVPDPKAGGLQGDGLYKSLVEQYKVLPDEYIWVKRHSWQSWQNRYKKNQSYFNEKMATIVAESGPPSKLQLYSYDRRATKRNRRTFGVKRLPSESSEDEHEEEEGLENAGEYTEVIGNASGTTRKRKQPSERHSFPAAKSSKRRKIPTYSDRIPSNGRHASMEYEIIEENDWNENEVLGSGEVVDAATVHKLDNAGSSQPPSPTLVAKPQSPDIDLDLGRPQLSVHQTPVVSPINFAIHSLELDVSAINSVSNVNQRKSQSSYVETVEDAPYRNTRARSRSVEPQGLPAAAWHERKRRIRQTVIQADELDPVIEDVGDVEATAQVDSSLSKSERGAREIATGDSASVTSVIVEEMDVERLLVTESLNSTTMSGGYVGESIQSVSQDQLASQTLRSDGSESWMTNTDPKNSFISLRLNRMLRKRRPP
ncbi:hypothetical protein BDQ17DRAFT_1418963 [Cyathus striatus]|nr:hypothetical protein BDQ17DRAFT_1418963 [Cyathus striatus]